MISLSSPGVLQGASTIYNRQVSEEECKSCNAKVDVDETGNLSVRHESYCPVEKDRLTRSFSATWRASSSRNNDSTHSRLLEMYPSLQDIMAAPDLCPCAPCTVISETSVIGSLHSRRVSSVDVFGYRRIDWPGLMMSLKDRLGQFGPAHPDFNDLTRRMETFVTNREDYYQFVAGVAEAGFFLSGEQVNRSYECFYCGLSVCKELLVSDPWREHARWMPVCPHVIQNKTENFVHEVIKETKDLKTYYRRLKRPSEMKIEIVLEATNAGYPHCLIREVIQHFFIENGCFPRRDEMFYILEQRLKWKTSTVPFNEEGDLWM